MMDATHPIWRTPTVHVAAMAGDFGALIRMSRTVQNLTLVQAGALCGYSASTMSRIETGRQPLKDVTLLRHFAEVFGIAAWTRPRATPFSATNVAIYQIGVRTALGDPGTGLDYARRIEIRSLPTAERQARFCVDTARAWHRFGDPRKCYQALHVAERFAPEELRRPSVRSLATGLLRTPGPVPSDLRAFVARIQASA